MGQILLEDKIGALSHSSGVITLAASRLTVGGQQYTTSALNRTIATDVTMAANTLYMIYAVVSGGVVSLRISANVNSVGPAGFTSWVLVGAFYSTAANTPVWGSFVNIEGPPETQTEVSEAGSTQLNAFYAGMSSFTVTNYNWSRVGRHLFVTIRLDSVTPNGVSFRIPLPRNITSIENNYHIGHYSCQNAAANSLGGSIIGVGSTDVGAGNSITSGSSISLAIGNTIMGTGPTVFGCTFRTHVAQWNSTPLKDL